MSWRKCRGCGMTDTDRVALVLALLRTLAQSALTRVQSAIVNEALQVLQPTCPRCARVVLRETEGKTS